MTDTRASRIVMLGKVFAMSAGSLYTQSGMREDAEDLNEFDSWDILGAMLMITLVPAVMNYVFNDRDEVGSAVIAGIGVLVSLAVFGLSLLTHWRIISKAVNLLGAVLTAVYILLAVYFWVWSGEPENAPQESVQSSLT